MRLTRRAFTQHLAAGIGTLTLGQEILTSATAETGKPNILWIVSEDNNPFLGCYGYKLARTPTLDRLAAEGILYENCFSQAPVCAPSRFTLITGMYATSCGPAHHMRAQGKIPSNLQGFPAYLRDAGYYCTNNAKTDYNAPINIKDIWDESSRTAHWRNRPAGKPFFAVFNHEVTHEGQLFAENIARYKPLPNLTDPARIELPPYHPDLPEFRTDWANYFDQMARLDEQVARLLRQLEEDGLAEDTIVFYYADNGGVLPRSKRFCYDSGLHVPLIIRFPKKLRHLAPANPGRRIDAPVSFVDFAATVLSLAGLDVPKHMQGHAFAGPKNAGPQRYAYCFRNRMDERYDMVRTARDKRYRYMRNYMPHLIYGQHVEYMFQMRSVQAWETAYREGKLSGPQKFFWEEKPAEELYDLQNDPFEVINLAASREHGETLQRMRTVLRQHMLDIRDNGFIPEGSPLEGYDMAHDSKAYPLERILEVADRAIQRDGANLARLSSWLADENECIRYWAALGCVMLREKAAAATEALSARLTDTSGSVRVAAAEALCHIGRTDAALAILRDCLLKDKSPWVRLQAANALQNLGPKARPALRAIKQASSDENDYVSRATKYTSGLYPE
jgi:arylsulfatase A-like enzyme